MTTSGPASTSYVHDAVELVLQIHQNEDKQSGHILVFLTGQDEIDRACREIREQLQSSSQQGVSSNEEEETLIVLPLYSTLQSTAQLDIFKQFYCKDGKTIKRKCIISTNIAETSITVPDVHYVIDSGYVKQKTYDPSRHMESLIIVPISQISSQQRAGRAGRTGPGKCYRLYSSDCYSNMMHETIPEILRTNLTNTILYLKVIGINDVLSFDFLDIPSKKLLLEGLLLLHMLGAIDDKGNCTELGKRMSTIPLEPKLSKAILTAGENGSLSEMIDIAALLSTESIWYDISRGGGQQQQQQQQRQSKKDHKSDKNQQNQEEIEQLQARYRHPAGDLLTYLQIFYGWQHKGNSSKLWCEDHGVNFRALTTARRIRDQIVRDVKHEFPTLMKQSSAEGQSIMITKELEGRLVKSLLSGYYMSSARCCSIGTYRALSGTSQSNFMYRNMPLVKAEQEDVMMTYLHPSSVLTKFTIPHPYVIYQDLVTLNGKPYLKHVLAVPEKELLALQSRWKEPVDPLVLTGRTIAVVKETTATTTGETSKKRSNNIPDELEEISKPVERVFESNKESASSAKERYLARKKLKS